jgi:N-acetylmuramoyl-L-alanine amidase
MAKTIAFCLDDGHGMETTYKSSPLTGMMENDFNRNVVRHIVEYCKANNILYKEVAQGDTDVPLATRTNLANAWYSELKKQHSDLYCIYISCHANAGGGTGSEIWVHSQAASETIKVAQITLDEITSSLGLKNRGVKKGFVSNPSADFHINRESKMTSMLVEYAFMDSEKDAQLLLSDDFRKACARATVKGILTYLNLPFTEPTQQPTIADEWELKYKEMSKQYTLLQGKYEGVLGDIQNIINKYK